MSLKEKRLTRRQDTFIAEYAKDGNATQAAIKAGYSSRTAKQQGSRLLTNVDLKQRLDRAIPLSLDALEDVAKNGKNETARVHAANGLLDRSLGKPITPIEVNNTVYNVIIDLTNKNEAPPPDDEILDLTEG